MLKEGSWIIEADTGRIGYIVEVRNVNHHLVQFIRTARGTKTNLTKWMETHEIEAAPLETWVDTVQVNMALDTKESEWFYQLLSEVRE